MKQVDVMLRRGKAGGFGMVLTSDSDGRAALSKLSGPAAESPLIRGDRIDSVNGVKTPTFKEAVEAVKACADTMKVCVTRDPAAPPLPSPDEVSGGSFGFLKFGAFLFVVLAILGGVLMKESTWDVLKALVPDLDAMEQASRPPPISFAEDGTVSDPYAMRARMLQDVEKMKLIRENQPDLAKILDGHEDGSFDTEAFQNFARDEKRRRDLHEKAKDALKRSEEDGSALDPDAFIEMGRQDADFMKRLKKEDARIHKIYKTRDTEGLQESLREQFMSEMRAKMPPPPPPPSTPYDDVGQVGMSFRILTDEGEEKDLYTLQADPTDDEKAFLALHMRCPACHAIAHQTEAALNKALAAQKKDDILSLLALETLQEMCGNQSLWTSGYGVQPTKRGENMLFGDGIPEDKDSFEGNQEVMLQTAHSSETGTRLKHYCEHLLLGADTNMEPEDIAAAVSSGTDLKSALCFAEGQPCADK